MVICPKCKSNLKHGAVRCRQCGSYVTSLEGIITTTASTIEGYEVYEYLGLVHSEAILDKDGLDELTIISRIDEIKKQVLTTIQERALEIEANAIIGLNTSIAELKGKCIINMDGTAVFTLPKELSPILEKIYLLENEQKAVEEHENMVSSMKEKTKSVTNSNISNLLIKYFLKYPEGDSVMHIVKTFSKGVTQQELMDTLNDMLTKNILYTDEGEIYKLSEEIRSNEAFLESIL